MLKMSSPEKIRNGNLFRDSAIKGAAQTSTVDFVTCHKIILSGLGRTDFYKGIRRTGARQS